MTNIPEKLLRPVQDLGRLRDIYQARTAPEQLRAGMEEETFQVSHHKKSFPLMDDTQNRQLSDSMRLHGISTISLEPNAAMLEVNPDPRPAQSPAEIIRDIESCRAVLNACAAETGVVRLPYSILPHVTRETAMANLVQPNEQDPSRGERQRLVTQAFSVHSDDPDMSIYPVSNTSVHFTHGICNPDHALDTKRVVYGISSAMLNVLDNAPPFILGAQERSRRHEALHFRSTLGNYGLVPSIVFEAADGDDYYRLLIERNLHKNLLTYPDKDGHYCCTPAGADMTFHNMMEEGCGTYYSYLMAQAQDWPIQKDKVFFDGNGQIVGLGNEVRDAGNGPASPGMVTSVYSAIAFSNDFRAELTDRIEKKYGLPIQSDPVAAYRLIRDDINASMRRASAREGSDRYLHAPFGTKGHTQQDFLQQDLVPMLNAHYRGTEMTVYVDALGHVADTLLSDAQFYADRLRTPRAVIRFCDPKLGYDPALLFNRAGKTMAQHAEAGHLPQLMHLQKRVSVPAQPPQQMTLNP